MEHRPKILALALNIERQDAFVAVLEYAKKSVFAMMLVGFAVSLGTVDLMILNGALSERKPQADTAPAGSTDIARAITEEQFGTLVAIDPTLTEMPQSNAVTSGGDSERKHTQLQNHSLDLSPREAGLGKEAFSIINSAPEFF